MPCTCIDKVNEKLAPMNGRIGLRFTFDAAGISDTIALTVEKITPRGKKPPGLLAKFCPICGTAYTPPDTKPLSTPSPIPREATAGLSASPTGA